MESNVSNFRNWFFWGAGWFSEVSLSDGGYFHIVIPQIGSLHLIFSGKIVISVNVSVYMSRAEQN